MKAVPLGVHNKNCGKRVWDKYTDNHFMSSQTYHLKSLPYLQLYVILTPSFLNYDCVGSVLYEELIFETVSSGKESSEGSNLSLLTLNLLINPTE